MSVNEPQIIINKGNNIDVYPIHVFPRCHPERSEGSLKRLMVKKDSSGKLKFPLSQPTLILRVGPARDP